MARMVRHPKSGKFVRKAGGGPKPMPKPLPMKKGK